MYRITLPALAYRAVSACASTEQSRPILNGVEIVQVGACWRITATDGHCLLTSYGPKSEDDTDLAYPVILPTFALSAVGLTASKAEDGGVVLTSPDGEQWTATAYWRNPAFATGKMVALRAIEGPYPNWQQVMPKGEPQPLTQIGFNLADPIAKLARGLGNVALTFYGADRAVMVQPSSGRVGEWETIGLVMPVRLQSSDMPTLPAWVNGEAPALVEA